MMIYYTIITTSLSPIIKQNQALLTIPNRVFFEIGYTVYPWDVVQVLDFRGYSWDGYYGPMVLPSLMIRSKIIMVDDHH
jgi:hypothetical protein